MHPQKHIRKQTFANMLWLWTTFMLGAVVNEFYTVPNTIPPQSEITLPWLIGLMVAFLLLHMFITSQHGTTIKTSSTVMTRLTAALLPLLCFALAMIALVYPMTPTAIYGCTWLFGNVLILLPNWSESVAQKLCTHDTDGQLLLFPD